VGTKIMATSQVGSTELNRVAFPCELHYTAMGYNWVKQSNLLHRDLNGYTWLLQFTAPAPPASRWLIVGGLDERLNGHAEAQRFKFT